MVTISELIELIRLRRIADEPPYKLVLGSDIQDLVFNREFSSRNIINSFSRLSRDERFTLLSSYTIKDQGKRYLHLAHLIAKAYFDIVVTTDPTNELETALLKEGLGTGDFDVIILGYDTKIENRLFSRTPKVKIVKLRGDLLHRSLDNFVPSDALKVNEVYEREVSSLIQTDSILLGVTNNDFDILRYIRNNDGAIWFILNNIPEAGGMLDAIISSRQFTNVVISPNLIPEHFFKFVREWLESSLHKSSERSLMKNEESALTINHSNILVSDTLVPFVQTTSQEVFISYAWGGESEKIVNELDQAFQKRGVKIMRDKRDLGFKGSIKGFMETIGKGKAVILIISEKYLKSENCLFELLQIAKHHSFEERIFPVVLEDSRIYKPIERIRYVEYWEQQFKELDDAMKRVSSANMHGFREDIDLYAEIRANLPRLTDILKDMNTLTPTIHRDANFKTLFEAVMNKLKE